MSTSRVAVIGASAGGVEALKKLVARLPARFSGAVLIVLHLPAGATSYLPAILGRVSTLPVTLAEQGEEILGGHIYTAPPDAHLLVQDGRMILSGSPRENGFRPAIDPLFRSAAVALGKDAVGIILSGTGEDGTDGLQAIKRAGGLAIVQDPDEAMFGEMPASAACHVDVDHVLPLDKIPDVLTRLFHLHPSEPNGSTDHLTPRTVAPSVELPIEAPRPDTLDAKLSPFICPSCGGPLWEQTHDDRTRFQCLVGHVFTSDVLLDEKVHNVEDALWSAVRALEERIDLTRRMASRMQRNNLKLSQYRFEEQARTSSEAARVIREILLSGLVSNRQVTPTEPLEERPRHRA